MPGSVAIRNARTLFASGGSGGGGSDNTKISVSKVLSHQSFSPTDALTYHFGENFGTAPQTTPNVSKFTFAKSGTITIAVITYRTAVVATNEAIQFYLRENNTTDHTLTLTYTMDAMSKSEVITGLNIAVVAGTTYEIKAVMPAWVTNPTNVVITVSLFGY